MKRKGLLISILIVSIVLIGGVVYTYVFDGEHRNIANEEATIIVSANKLHADFLANESLATTTYLDKVLEVKGLTTSTQNGEVILEDKIQISISSDVKPTLEKKNITIKGRCIGYDELLEMVKIDQAIIINKDN